ncbi:MAG TPA: hypothetical protein VGI58_05490 [Streptosporangiaceae bacterium]|jgi:hypothetical protein
MTPKRSARNRRLASVVLVAAVPVLLGVTGVAASASPVPAASPQAAAPNAAFTKTETLTRTNLVNGVNQVVDSNTVSVSVNQTQDLRNRQVIDVSWTGAHPTGGIVPQDTGPFGGEQEYPVVLMMCRGSASATSGKNLITPETCWTETSPERIQQDPGTFLGFPPYRLDEHASAADRAQNVGLPNPVPANCKPFTVVAAQHWVPFIAANGTVYPYGPGTPPCGSAPPEATNSESTEQPSNTTYGVTGTNGDGSSRFDITTAETNASLGCSDTVACSLVVIPIMGISCDPAGSGLPPGNPADLLPTSMTPPTPSDLCESTGHFKAGAPDLSPSQNGNPGFGALQDSLAVQGYLWWSASNWRNRIQVPLTFAQPSNICSLESTSAPLQIFGSYYLLGATQQWAPHFCLNKKLFALTHVIQPEPEAQSEVEQRSIDAAFEAEPPSSAFTSPIVQAPTAVSGFAIVFDIVTADGQQLTSLHLDARLLAKLLTESYPEDTDTQADPADRNRTTGQMNPLDIAFDPEFQALNPGIPTSIATQALASSATLLVQSAGSSAMWALTSYINADPEARAWLNGQPDPWGMVVNVNYKGIQLPVSQWPLLDTYVPKAFYTASPCFSTVQNPPPWLNQVASPIDSLSTLSLDMQFDVSDSVVSCSGGTVPAPVPFGPESPGATFILGLTSLSDADEFGLPVASLESQGGSTLDTQFTTGAGRTFVAPTDASLRSAVAMMQPDTGAGSWDLPYSALRTGAAGKEAYPGTLLISTDVPTTGLKKSVAQDYGEFLSFAAGPGQRAGNGNGEVPAGYLPMTAANGAGKLADYTKVAAADVTAQNGKVPTPGQGLPGPATSHSPGTSSGSGGSSASQPSSSASGGTSGSPAPSTSAPVTTSPGQAAPKLVPTALVRSAIAGDLLPLVLLVALVIATIGFAFWQLRRPTVPK